MRNPSCLSALSRFASWGTFFLLAITPQMAGQSLEPKQAPTRNSGTLFESMNGWPARPKAEQSGSGTGTNPILSNAAGSLAVPGWQMKFPAAPHATPFIAAWILPPSSNLAKADQTTHPPALNLSNPFNVHHGPTEIISDLKIPQAPPRHRHLRPPLCSVPLLLIEPDPAVHFVTTKLAPAPSVDQSMIVEPPAPSCDE